MMQETPFYKTTLANGLRVLTGPMPHTHSVSISVYIGAGSRYESPREAGLAHFIEHLCFKGTERRPTHQEISRLIDSVGGTINAATDRELTVFYCKVARPHFELALDVITDLIRSPLFEAEEMEKERKVVIEELAMVADSPAQQVDLLLDETLWPDQPLGRDVAGTNETVMALSRDMALAYLRRQYVPNNMVVSIAGAVSHDEVVDRVGESLGDWQRGVPGGWFPAVNGQHGPRAAVKHKTTEQAHMEVGLRGIPILHPDRFRLSLLNSILGDGMSSRLNEELRERRGLCYDVHSYPSFFQDAGAFTCYAGVDPSDADEALTALLSELARVRDEEVSDEELSRAKELSKGRLLLRMEDTRAVSDWMGAQELLTGRVRTVEQTVALIDAVTVADVRAVAQRLFRNDRLNLAVVGPFRSSKRFEALLRL